jgi:hypothetical protein
MNAEQARENVACMVSKTRKDARVGLMKHAIGPIGNLTEEAREVYREQLRKDGAL